MFLLQVEYYFKAVYICLYLKIDQTCKFLYQPKKRVQGCDTEHATTCNTILAQYTSPLFDIRKTFASPAICNVNDGVKPTS